MKTINNIKLLSFLSFYLSSKTLQPLSFVKLSRFRNIAKRTSTKIADEIRMERFERFEVESRRVGKWRVIGSCDAPRATKRGVRESNWMRVSRTSAGRARPTSGKGCAENRRKSVFVHTMYQLVDGYGRQSFHRPSWSYRTTIDVSYVKTTWIQLWNTHFAKNAFSHIQNKHYRKTNVFGCTGFFNPSHSIKFRLDQIIDTFPG